MTKRFCDLCNKELDFSKVLRRIIPAQVHGKSLWVDFQVSTSAEHVHGFGDVCRDCVWAAIDRMDPRDKPKQAEQ